MKRWFPLLLLLFIMYFSFEILFKMYSKGYNITYQVKTEGKKFEINETYSTNKKGELSNYYLEIAFDENIYSAQILENFKNKQKIIKNIYHVKTNEYSCILPIFLNNKILTDIICLKDNIQYNYHTIEKNDNKIDEFADVMRQKGYDSTLYIDRKQDAIKEKLYTLYPNNIIENHIMAFNTYKGAEVISNATPLIKSVELFDSDIYEPKIKTMIKKYYVIANYNDFYEFDTFYVLNLTTGIYKKIESQNKISFDSYVQGVVGNSIYLYDEENKVQYEINVNKEKIKMIGNATIGYKIYTNGEWEVKPLKDIVDKTIIFTEKIDSSLPNYIFLTKTNTKQTGYHYYYKKTNSGYQLYRSNTQNNEKLTYLTTISSIDNVKAINDYLYFIEENQICYYHDLTGVRTLINYPELQFNKNIIYNVNIK